MSKPTADFHRQNSEQSLRLVLWDGWTSGPRCVKSSIGQSSAGDF